MGVGKFFHAGPIEDVILDCYRLSKQYSIDPEVFLNKPLSVIERHMRWTAKLIELQQPVDDE